MLCLTKMKVKTESGVSITIIPEGSSKIMLFDRPVRLIEFKKEEVSQMSVLLASNLETKRSIELKRCHPHPTKVTKAFSR